MQEVIARASLVFGVVTLAAFTVVALWESSRPLRPAGAHLNQRWLANFGLWVVNHLALYLTVPLLALLTAALVGHLRLGLLNDVAVGLPVQAGIALLALDLTRWAGHLGLHRSALLWRIHQVHHCDLEFDVTVGVRFHPLEALYQALLSAAVVAVLGLPLEAVLLAELVFIAHNFFCHANAALPERLERVLCRVVITPDLHRVHHDAEPARAMRNFGTVFSFWDRWAGLNLALPRAQMAQLGSGVMGIGGAPSRNLWRLLWMPVRQPAG
jgi:sterol desaturase/sphingolipid hydroxylase (fatty acid hydroxylase superfamily)